MSIATLDGFRNSLKHMSIATLDGFRNSFKHMSIVILDGFRNSFKHMTAMCKQHILTNQAVCAFFLATGMQQTSYQIADESNVFLFTKLL
jgi:hypothetical protein